VFEEKPRLGFTQLINPKKTSILERYPLLNIKGPETKQTGGLKLRGPGTKSTSC
jgi:hypothetical protein